MGSEPHFDTYWVQINFARRNGSGAQLLATKWVGKIIRGKEEKTTESRWVGMVQNYKKDYSITIIILSTEEYDRVY